MTTWSERRLVEAIETNRYQAFASFGRSPHGHVHEDAQMLRLFTGITVLSPLCGWIFRAQLPAADINEEIGRALNPFVSRRLPVIWNTGPSTRPPDLETHLLQYGLAPLFELAGMAADLDTLVKDLHLPAGLQILPVSSSEALRQWVEAFTTGFNVAGNVEASVYDLFTSLVFDSEVPWYHFVGLLDGVPVATSAMYVGAGVVGVYFVATVPQARRRGVGSLLTLAPLKKAIDMSYEIAVLHASPMAVSMYHSLGFQEYCRMGLFAWQPDD